MEPQIYNTLSQNKQLSLEGTFGTSEYLVTKGFAVNGYIYVNLFSNMILLLPITLYLIYNKLKENKSVGNWTNKDVAKKLYSVINDKNLHVKYINYGENEKSDFEKSLKSLDERKEQRENSQ